MPIRFQVDIDFYDHPKAIDASDAAVALWTRAGSYSASKLIDGFVPEAKLAQLSKTPTEAAAELVRCGLWRRVKGGYRFHEWDHRNLTKARVEADRKADRERKARGRSEGAHPAGKNGKPQAEPTIVRPESGVSPDGIPSESDRIPGDSVSVSVSVSESSKNTPRKRGRVTDDDPHFAEFWAAYPRPIGKGHARKAWAARLNDGADPRAIIEGAARFRDDPRRSRDEKFIPYPATWINGERWADGGTIAPPATAGDDLFERWWEN